MEYFNLKLLDGRDTYLNNKLRQFSKMCFRIYMDFAANSIQFNFHPDTMTDMKTQKKTETVVHKNKFKNLHSNIAGADPSQCNSANRQNPQSTPSVKWL